MILSVSSLCPKAYLHKTNKNLATFLSHKTIGEKKNMQKILCPVCKQDGVLQWKETITKAKGRMYHYKKLYVYHHHPEEHSERPKWCYLTAEHVEALGITQKSPITQNLTQNDLGPNNLKLGSVEENRGGRSLAWLGHRLPKPTTRVRIPVTAPKAACALFQ